MRGKMNGTYFNGVLEINFSNKLIVSICYAIIEVFGLSGNILVILTVYSGRRRFQSNYYRLVFHLAICDILLLLSGNLIFTVGPWIENQYWSNSLRTVSCVIISPLVRSLFNTELAILVVIAILRHKAVTQPLQPRLSRKKLQYIIALLYIAPLFVNIPKFLSQLFSASSVLCSNKWEDNIYFFIYGWILNIGETLVFMMFLIVLYAKMCYSLVLHQKNLRRLFSPQTTNISDDGAKRATTSHQHLRIEKNTKMITVSVVVLAQFFIAVFPLSVLGRMVAHGREEAQFHVIWSMPLYFLVSCSFNPIVYGIGDKTIREGYKMALKKLCCCC